MKKKLLLVVPLPPPMHGSNLMNQYVVNCRQLCEKYTVKVLPLHYAASIADIGSMRIKKFFSLCGYLVNLFYRLVFFRPDVVYFVPAVIGISFYRDCLFALIFKCFDVHVIYHLHGKGVRNKLDSSLLIKLYRWFFRNATVIHLSSLLYDDIQDVVLISQCRFLPNGMEESGLYLPDRARTVSRKPVILFLSNLIVSKGPIIVLKACQILKDKGLDFKTYFVGNPSADLTVEVFSDTIERMGLHNHVEYLGPRYGRDKYEILRKSNIFAFPTFYEKEIFPLVLLEAMAAGLPVVSTHEGAIPEIVDDGVTGFVVEKSSPDKLAEKIEYMISNPEQAKKMGQAGRTKFEQNYTKEKFYKNLIKIFDDVFVSLIKTGG